VEYILGLFADEDAALRASDALKDLGLQHEDYHVRTPRAATRSVKGWFEWLFDMPEPLAGLEAQGIPHEDSSWYEDRIESGETLVAARTSDRRGTEIAQTLRRAGAHDVRRYLKRAEGWTRFTGEDEAKTA
jgi:hypothetical protein